MVLAFAMVWLNAALRLFEEMEARDGGGHLGFGIHSALVGRRDAIMRLYREMQVCGYKQFLDFQSNTQQIISIVIRSL